MAVAAADEPLRSPPQNRHPLCIAPLGQTFGTGRVFAVVTQEMEIIGKERSGAELPLSSCQSPPAYS